MRRGRRERTIASGLVAASILALAGCSSDVTLAVDLRTDLVPGIEVTRAVTVVTRGAAPMEAVLDREVALAEAADLVAGSRVAETPTSPGAHRITVTLVGPDGGEVASRTVQADVDSTAVVTVLITRDCRGVACPGPADAPTATECFGGRCVAPDCAPENPDLCPVAECQDASECPAADACAEPVCASGACLFRSLAGRCADDEWCDPAVGCRPRMEPPLDAGPAPDAGSGVDAGAEVDAGPPPIDAGNDSGVPGVDAGVDAGTDAGPGVDAGAPPPTCDDLCPVPCELGVCVLRGMAAPVCPDGVECQVLCEAGSECSGGVTCGDGACRVDCDLPGSCPTVDCSRSPDCDFRCIGSGTCGEVQCGTGVCAADCSGRDSCSTLECGPDRCTVSCDGDNACEFLNCLASSDCRLSCGGTSTCFLATCGSGRCDVSCGGPASCFTVSCESACRCDVLCTGGACDSVTCPLPECASGAGCTSLAPPSCDTC